MGQNKYLLASIAAGALGAIGIVATVAALNGNDSDSSDEPVPDAPGAAGTTPANGLHHARLDLAERLGIDPEDVKLVSIQHTGWDGCLGVVVENGVCTEIFIAGTIAIFGIEGQEQTYRYHVGGDRFIATDFVDGTVDDGTPLLPGDMAPDSAGMLYEYLRGDLALHLDVEIDQVIVDGEEVTWPDSCLGVAFPNATCLVGAVDGYRAVLTVAGSDDEYLYHGSLAGEYIAVWAMEPGTYTLVEPLGDDGAAAPDDSGDAADGLTGGRIKEPKLAMRDDLAGQLGVDIDDVKIEDYDEVTWPDGCTGVYYNDALCTQALVDGWLATLTVEGSDKEYRYHGSFDGGFIAVWSLDPDEFRLGEPIDD